MQIFKVEFLLTLKVMTQGHKGHLRTVIWGTGATSELSPIVFEANTISAINSH